MYIDSMFSPTISVKIMLNQRCKSIMTGCSAILSLESDVMLFERERDHIQISDQIYYLTGKSSFGVMLNVAVLSIDALPLKPYISQRPAKAKWISQ